MTRKTCATLLTSLLLATAFSLVLYTFNSPLGPGIGSDNAIYLTMGTALAQGYVPYTQIFDHKGPLLFILEAIPQVFAGGYSTFAVWIMEVLFLWGCLLLTAHMTRRLGGNVLLMQLVYLALCAPIVGGGNLSEEYTNLFTLAGLDVMLRAFSGDDGLGGADGRKLRLPATCMGALSMLCLLTRANNALALLGATAALALCLLIARRFAPLGACALFFLIGALISAFPVMLWLAHYGQGVLSESIYGSIIHNLMYAETDGGSRIHMLLFSDYGHYALLIALLACAGAAAMYARTRRIAIPLAMVLGAAGAGAAAFVSHKYYQHYLMLGVPMAALGAAALTSLAGRFSASRQCAVLGAAALCCCAALAVTGQQANAQRSADHRAMQALIPDAQALYAQVPKEERGRFMAYRVEPKWYVAAQALPCMRFYFLQETLAQADPRVMDEIVATFEADPPLWLVIFYNREFGPPYDERVAEIFETCYEFVDAAGEYQLLHLKN